MIDLRCPIIAITLACNLIEAGNDLRAHLQHLIATLKSNLKLKTWRLMPSQTAVQPLIIGSILAGQNLNLRFSRAY